MKKTLILVLLIESFIHSVGAFADEYVQGYYTTSGTYVQPHYRSEPDNSFHNNYGSDGVSNPYTGSVGTRSYDSYSNSQHKVRYGR